MENHTDSSAEDRSLTDGVGFLLARASGLFARAGNAALVPFGLRVRSYSVLLLACEAAEGISQRDLAGVLGLDPSQVVLPRRRPGRSGPRGAAYLAVRPADETGRRDGDGHALRSGRSRPWRLPRRSSSRLCLPPSAVVLHDLLLRVVGEAVELD